MAVFFCIAYEKGFMRNPKLAPLLLTLHYGQSTVQYVFNVFYSHVFNDVFLTYFILAIRYVLYVYFIKNPPYCTTLIMGVIHFNEHFLRVLYIII